MSTASLTVFFQRHAPVGLRAVARWLVSFEIYRRYAPACDGDSDGKLDRLDENVHVDQRHKGLVDDRVGIGGLSRTRTIGIYRVGSGQLAAIPVCLLGYGFALGSVGSLAAHKAVRGSARGPVLRLVSDAATRSNVNTLSGRLDSGSPRRAPLRGRGVQYVQNSSFAENHGLFEARPQCARITLPGSGHHVAHACLCPCRGSPVFDGNLLQRTLR